MDSRSSLAARRTKLCSSAGRSSSSGGRSSSTGVAEGTVRHGGSELGSSGGVTCAADGLAASASAASRAEASTASRAESASWIAESAASVGSLIFFGVFAMSVVASYYAGLEQRQERILTALRARLALRSPPEPPRAAGSHAPHRQFTAVRLSYRLGIPKETAC